MEIRELRYFAAVAKERHFGRAAKALYISQPSLSYAIKTMETRLGVQLFRRHSRGIDLTDAGIEILSVTKAILRRVDTIEEIAGRHRQGESGRLRIGWQASGAGRLSTVARQQFAARYPNVHVETHTYGWGKEVTALRDGAVDVSFIWLPADPEGLHMEIVAKEQRMCVVSTQHHLSDRTQLSIMDLVDEPWMRSATAPQEWLDWWIVNPRPDGSQPKWWPRTAENIEELLEQVSEGQCVATVAASVATYYPRPDLVFTPIIDIEPLSIALGWLEGNDSPIVARFATIVRELAGAVI